MAAQIPPAAREAHDRAVCDGEPSYEDPATGATVLTSAFLASQERCCGSGCRHCPYDEDERRRAGRPPSR